MPQYTYGSYAAYDPIRDVVVENAVNGKLVLVKDGPAQPIWDLNNQPVSSITSNGSGQTLPFKADVLRGLIQFGDVVVTVWSNDVGALLEQALGAQAAAERAAAAAEQALAAIGSGGTPGAGGGTITAVNGDRGPEVNLVADEVPDGTGKSITTKDERSLIGRAFLKTGSLNMSQVTNDAGKTLTEIIAELSQRIPIPLAAGAAVPTTNPVPQYYLQPVAGSTTTTPTTPAAVRVGTPQTGQTGTSTLRIPLPLNTAGGAATTAGDVALVVHQHNSSDAAVANTAVVEYSTKPNADSTWLGKASQTIAFNNRYEIWAKDLSSTDIAKGAVTFDYSGPQKASGALVVMRNVKGGAAAVLAQITKDTASVTVRAIPQITLSGATKWKILTTYSERRSGPSTDGTAPTGSTKEFWLTGTGGGATALALATFTADTTGAQSPAGNWTTTAGGTTTTTNADGTTTTTNTAPATSSGYVASIAIPSN